MSAPDSKVAVSRTKRSPVWSFFEEIGSTGMVKCKLWSRELAKQSGTTNLLNHLKGSYAKHYVQVSGPGTSGSGQEEDTTSTGTKPLSHYFVGQTVSAAPLGRERFLTLYWIG